MENEDYWAGSLAIVDGLAFECNSHKPADLNGLESASFVSDYVFALGFLSEGKIIVTAAKDMPTDAFFKSQKNGQGKAQILKNESDTYVCFNTKNIFEVDEEEHSLTVCTDNGRIKCEVENLDIPVLKESEVVFVKTSLAPQKKSDEKETVVFLQNCQLESVKKLPKMMGKQAKQIRNIPIKERNDDLMLI